MSDFLTRAIFSTGLLLVLGAAKVPAAADDGTHYVAPGAATLIFPDWATLLITRLDPQLRRNRSGRKMCGHYQSATTTYADGSAMGEVAASS